MSNLADLITTANEVISPSIFNAKTIWNTSGTNLANHDINQDVGAVVVNETGSGYLVDHMYIRNAEKSTWVDVFKNHLHTSDLDGGSFFSIKQAIAKSILEFNFQNAKVGMFLPNGAGTSVNSSDSTTSYIEMTSTVAANPANLWAGGLRLFFGKPFILQYKYKIFNNTNVIWRAGCGMSAVENSGNQNQLGFEGCLNTDARTSLVAGNGTTRTPTYLSASLQTNPLGLRVDFYPNDKAVATDGLGTLVNKTDSLPLSSGATDSKSTFRVGVKTTNASAGDTRVMDFFSAYLVGHIYDSESGVGAWL
jgi:hypothetical protein